MLISASVLALGTIVSVQAATSPVLITALQTGGTANASAEFVRITNTSAGIIDVSGWRIQYKSAAGTTWTTRATVQGNLGAHASILASTTEFATSEPHQPLLSGMSASGGHVQLIDKTNLMVDLVGWGNAIAAAGSPAPAPAAGQTLQRKSTAADYVNTGNNAADFTAIQGAASATNSVTDSTTGAPSDSPKAAGQATGHIIISELLPNPASPQTDSKDEFIELFNTGGQDVTLTGYKLQTGSNNRYSHTFTSADSLPANGYAAFKITQTKTTLSNSGGKARVLDPSGATLYETMPYSTAAEGQAWALVDGTWDWTTSPTPGSDNVLTVPVAKTVKTSKVSGSASSSAKSSGTAKKSTVKKVAGTSAKNGTAGQSGDKNAVDFAAPSPIHPLVLAVVGGSALAYAGYEYRQDFLNRFDQLRRYIKSRRGLRAKV